MSQDRPSLKRLTELPARLGVREDRAGHKGTYGAVALVAGNEGMLGAAILAAKGALRGGAGLVHCILPRELMAPFTVAVPSATTFDRSAWDAIEPFPPFEAMVCGPGLPRAVAAEWMAAVRSHVGTACVLDAGALTRRTIDAARHVGLPLILTPHPGEAARLLETTADAVQDDRESAVRRLVDRFAPSIVVLKGAGTLVCDGERIYENATGNPGLGTGGSGDVLAGLLGALLAQGMPLFDAACFGAYLHGRAGDLVASRLSEPGLCADDLPLAIAELLREEVEGSSA